MKEVYPLVKNSALSSGGGEPEDQPGRCAARYVGNKDAVPGRERMAGRGEGKTGNTKQQAKQGGSATRPYNAQQQAARQGGVMAGPR